MRLVFIYYSERVYKDKEGRLYTGGNFPKEVWDRYLSIADKLVVVMRRGGQIEKNPNMESSLEYIDTKKINVLLLDDFYSGLSNFFNWKLRRKNINRLKKTLSSCNAVIVREGHSPVMKEVRRSGKPYVIEVIGDPLRICWNHGLKGKAMAVPEYMRAKYEIKRAKWIIYVTNRYLQKIYPTKGYSAAISDVALQDTDGHVLKNRLDKIKKMGKRVVLGTAAALDVKYKGHQYVIKAISKLKKRGFLFEYQVVGAGTGAYIRTLSKKYGVEEDVKILGQLSHKNTLEWMKAIDVYVNPSLTEGLSRSVVEAVSLSVPCIASNVGGNPELVQQECLFTASRPEEIVRILMNIDKDKLCSMAKKNFSVAQRFKTEKLNRKREKFMNRFKSNEGLLNGQCECKGV